MNPRTYTQTEIARAFGMRQQTIQDYERRALRKLREALVIDPRSIEAVDRDIDRRIGQWRAR